jgi:ribosomal protein L11 methylase PrmA
MMSSQNNLASSFRDPSGFMFRRDGTLYRQVNMHYQAEYDKLTQAGLLDELTLQGLLIHAEEADVKSALPELAYKILKPTELPLISYPYEWSFSQYKDAALATLEIQKRAYAKGFALKDASAYNIQFYEGKPVFIDTLSFETYKEGEPWIAYKQFCQHFLAPLALMSQVDIRLSQLMRVYIDGIPLDLASKLLPGSTKFNLGLNLHIHTHASAQLKYADKPVAKKEVKGQMGRNAFLGLMDSLESTIKGLTLKGVKTEWAEYYDATNYSDSSLAEKGKLVEAYLSRIKPTRVWDLGANTGYFSRIASDKGIFTAAFDIDPMAVEQAYQVMKEKKEKYLLPLVLDLTNPSPAIGWHNAERDSFLQRGPVDCVMALALIHHLSISNNVPLPILAQFFSSACKYLIIEFVPKEDSQVERLLATREDIFPTYNIQGFEAAFTTLFNILDAQPIGGSKRTLYLLERK